MRTQLAAATALLLALPLTAAAQPTSAKSACAVDPVGDVQLAGTGVHVAAEHVDLRGFELVASRTQFTIVICPVRVASYRQTDVRFVLDFTVRGRDYRFWFQPSVRDAVKNEYRNTFRAATPLSSTTSVVRAMLVAYECTGPNCAVDTGLNDSASWRR